jgi:hypothetical protein
MSDINEEPPTVSTEKVDAVTARDKQRDEMQRVRIIQNCQMSLAQERTHLIATFRSSMVAVLRVHFPIAFPTHIVLAHYPQDIGKSPKGSYHQCYFMHKGAAFDRLKLYAELHLNLTATIYVFHNTKSEWRSQSGWYCEQVQFIIKTEIIARKKVSQPVIVMQMEHPVPGDWADLIGLEPQNRSLRDGDDQF